MKILIDGFNFILCNPDLKKRFFKNADETIGGVAAALRDRFPSEEICLVFDEQESRPTKWLTDRYVQCGVSVRYVSDADVFIMEEVRSGGEGLVVTSDWKDISSNLRYSGWKSVSSHEFYQRVFVQKKRRERTQNKNYLDMPLPDIEVDRWQEFFRKRRNK